MKISMARWARVSVLAVLSVVAVAACTGDDDDDGAGSLESGSYTFTATEILNSGWPAGNPPLVGVPVPLTIAVVNATAFTMSATGTAGGFLVPQQEVGLINEGGFLQSQMGPVVGEVYSYVLHLTSACSLDVGASMAGSVTDDGFEATFYTGFAVADLNSAGTMAADCTTHPATFFDGFTAFPNVLAGGTGSTAGVSSTGVASRNAD